MRRLIVLYTFVTVLYASCVKQKPKLRPNIVFIFADDLGWNDVGFNNPDVISPNIDHLAKTGVILNQSYVQPVCSPTRAALMTGVYPFRLGLSHMVLKTGQDVCAPLDRTLLPQVLKQNGYSTHMVGKWHLGFCKWECTPTYRGFDTFYGFYQAQEDFYTKMNGAGYDFRDGEKVDKRGNGTHSTYLYRNRIEEIISNHDTSNPLFMYVAFQEVHIPLQALPEYYDLYPNMNETDRRKALALVTALDTTIGALVQALKDKGLYDNTLIVFSADNGGMVADGGNNFPLRGGKATLFEGGIRAAAFVHGPMFEKVGVTYDGLIHVVDWYPTLVEAAGVNTKVLDQDGVSQWNSILSLSSSNRSEVVYNLDFSEHPFQGKSAIRIGDYKLITGFPGLFREWYQPSREAEYSQETKELRRVMVSGDSLDPKVVEEAMYRGQQEEDFKYLFNMKDDPEERNNIYDQKPELVQRLTERLEYHKTRYATPNYPPINPNSDPARWGGVWSPGWC